MHNGDNPNSDKLVTNIDYSIGTKDFTTLTVQDTTAITGAYNPIITEDGLLESFEKVFKDKYGIDLDEFMDAFMQDHPEYKI